MRGIVRPRPDPRPAEGRRPRVSGRFLYVERREAVGARRDLRHVHALGPGRRRLRPGQGRCGLRPDAVGRHQRSPPVHRASAVAAGCGAAARPVGGRRHPLGGAHHVPRPARAAARDRFTGGGGRARDRRSRGHHGLQHRQRDPLAHRSLAWGDRGGGLPRAPGRCGPRGRPRCLGHVRQLSLDRVPQGPRSRLRLLERLPRGRRGLRTLRGPAAEPIARSARGHRGAGSGQPAQGRRLPGLADRDASAGHVRRRGLGHVRVRLDGRVGPQRRGRRRLGLRTDDA